ncbi:GGH (predicted) [Pycnogonum litorale]
MLKTFILKATALISMVSICTLSLVEGYVKPFENSRPIIGIITQETNDKLRHYGKEIIPASYVKMVEAAGGRVAVIKGNQPYEYYKKMFSQINGALFTGGWVSIEPAESIYAQSGKYIFELAVEANKRGDVFPIWGTCLGFELLSYLLSGRNVMKDCFTWDQVLPLNYTKDYKNSQLYGAMPDDMSLDLGTLALTINYHKSCLLYEDYDKYKMNRTMKLLSTNMDYNGTEFVSTFEARDYPFFATQWHPEKILFEFVSRPKEVKNTPHFSRAVEISQWISRFFIDYARKSTHRFLTTKAEDNVLIYKYNTKFGAPLCSMYETVFIIKPHLFSSEAIVIIVLSAIIFSIMMYMFYKSGRCGFNSPCISCIVYKNKDSYYN